MKSAALEQSKLLGQVNFQLVSAGGGFRRVGDSRGETDGCENSYHSQHRICGHKEILPINPRKGNGVYQAEELPENTLIWTQNVQLTLYGQWLR